MTTVEDATARTGGGGRDWRRFGRRHGWTMR